MVFNPLLFQKFDFYWLCSKVDELLPSKAQEGDSMIDIETNKPLVSIGPADLFPVLHNRSVLHFTGFQIQRVEAIEQLH